MQIGRAVFFCIKAAPVYISRAPLEPHIKAGVISTLPRELYGPLMLGPTREFLQQWLVRRAPADLRVTSQQLADAAWKALAARA